MKQPKRIFFYETTSGVPVKSLDEWKRAELRSLIFPGQFTQLSAERQTDLENFATLILEEADSIIEILSVKEKGRPLNRKDSKPRVRVKSAEPKAA